MKCTLIAVLAALVVAAAPVGETAKPDTLTVNVPATANPYLAGMPGGTAARAGDSAPQQSPVLVERTLSHAVAVTFRAVGAMQHTPDCPPQCFGPNGAEWTKHQGGAEHGISDIGAPMNALVGVFLTDDSPDRSKAPRPLDSRSVLRATGSVAPMLKQVFLIGDGKSNGVSLRPYIVPRGATRLYLGVMDGYEWNNNSGSFTVTLAVERDQVDSQMYAVDSNITYGKWACLPGRMHCTPDRATVEERGPGEFHVVLPASSEWGISVPAGEGSATIHVAEGTVCLSADLCVGPQGTGNGAGAGFLDPQRPAGALILRVIDGRVYFSVNHRKGAPFRDDEGYFEFDVRTRR